MKGSVSAEVPTTLLRTNPRRPHWQPPRACIGLGLRSRVPGRRRARRSSGAGVCASVTDTLAFGEWSESRICHRPCHELGYGRRVRNDVSQGSERVRSAEVIAALCLATDLGMGFPFEHGLHSTLMAARLAGRLGLDRLRASQTYYACLLSHSGCTTDAHVAAEVVGGSLTTHLNPVMYGSTRETLGGLLHALPDPDTRGGAMS